MSRKYTQRKRAEQQEQTRSRIVQATMELHEEVGPARTTIMAIAERAGVERLTVYRHFPDQDELFRACSSRFLELVPPPHPSAWSAIEDPGTRTRRVLEAFYAYYDATETMWIGVYRDLSEVEALATVVEEFHEHLGGICDDLIDHWNPARSSRAELRGIIRHALEFTTWKSLRSSGFGNRKIASLIINWAEAISTD